MVNFCPVCKREYRQKAGCQTGWCPASPGALVRMLDEDPDQIRQEQYLQKRMNRICRVEVGDVYQNIDEEKGGVSRPSTFSRF
jgi:hypothetical protein